MRYQDYIVDQTKKAAKETFKYARAVPEDKLSWKPLDSGRSVLDQCREIAMTPGWGADIVDGVPMDWSEEALANINKEKEQWATIDDCENEFNRRMERMSAVFLAIPDERLSETKWLPFDGGRDFTFQEMMDYPRWNATYHLGQIAYVQTLYGDGEMH